MSPERIRTAAEDLHMFLAHAIELEAEAAERYEELAESMEVHNNLETAELFRRLGRYSRQHRDEIIAIANLAGPLPKVAPWEFAWLGAAESPEAAAFEDAHYLMTPRHALTMALSCEEQARAYYQAVADQSGNADVVGLAREFAEEEGTHVEFVKELLDRQPADPESWDEDPDPPNYNE